MITIRLSEIPNLPLWEGGAFPLATGLPIQVKGAEVNEWDNAVLVRSDDEPGFVHVNKAGLRFRAPHADVRLYLHHWQAPVFLGLHLAIHYGVGTTPTGVVFDHRQWTQRRAWFIQGDEDTRFFADDRESAMDNTDKPSTLWWTQVPGVSSDSNPLEALRKVVLVTFGLDMERS